MDEAEIYNTAIRYLQDTDPDEYRRLRQAGELADWGEAKTQAVRDEAQALMKSGIGEGPAWHEAIQSQIFQRGG